MSYNSLYRFPERSYVWYFLSLCFIFRLVRLSLFRTRYRAQHAVDKARAVGLAEAFAFYWVRSLPSLQKKPSTSELIDWIRALTYSGIPMDQITSAIPFAGVLLKKNEDLENLERAKARRRF